MNVCPFCSEVIKKRLIKDGENVFVVLSSPRITLGHLLVIPKRHVQKFSELKVEEMKELFEFLAYLQNKILEKLSKGVEVRQNFRPYMKNTKTHVNHLHFNVFPRDENDEIEKTVDVYRRSLYKYLSKKEQEKLLALLSD